MDHPNALAGAAGLPAENRRPPATWLSVGAMGRVLAAMTVLALLWLLVAWAVALP